MKIEIIKCRSLLNKSNLPRVDYCINPYIGCLHGCIYCYSRFMKRFTKHKENWGEFLDIKINAGEVLEAELRRHPPKMTVLLGSVTDAYQPVEEKYKITRNILEILVRYDFPISILTKSDLVNRDIDLFKQFSKCDIGLTITTLDENVRKDFEPRACSSQQRLQALQLLHENSISTYAFIGPILPYLTDLAQIFHVLKGKVDFIMGESLNLKCGNWENIHRLIEDKYPHLLSVYEKNLDQQYWDKIGKELEQLSKNNNIPLKGFFQH